MASSLDQGSNPCLLHWQVDSSPLYHQGRSKVKVLVAQSCPTLCDPMDYSPPPRILCPWDFPGKNMEWLAILFSRWSSSPRDWTQVSCIAYRLREGTTREVLHILLNIFSVEFSSNKAHIGNSKFLPGCPCYINIISFFCLQHEKRLWNVILGRGSHICKGLELREHDFYENCKQFSTSREYEIDDGAAVKREDI